MNDKYLYISGDCSDGDYLSKLVKVNEEDILFFRKISLICKDIKEENEEKHYYYRIHVYNKYKWDDKERTLESELSDTEFYKLEEFFPCIDAYDDIYTIEKLIILTLDETLFVC